VNSRRIVLLILGVVLLLAGIVFSLQGADIITGSSLMSGNPTYIYVGAVVAIIGLALLVLSSRVGKKPASPTAAGQKPP
jgi:divalent metal cation (Fe/Co/Zn/Cd) transporter